MEKKLAETDFNYIYSKTYNFIYLRAKAMLHDEKEARALVRDVYVQLYTHDEELKEENLYEWLGKCVYHTGYCRLRQKKMREASSLVLKEEELQQQSAEISKEDIEAAGDVLEKLPDMYFSTLIAFYYDYLKVDEIAELMECTPGAIRYRLNYARKCLEEAMGDKISFSASAVCTILSGWAKEHCLGMTGAQHIYTEICEECDLTPTPIYLAGKDFAGVNHTVIYRPQNNWDHLLGEIGAEKGCRETKKRGLIVGAIVLAIAVLVLVIAIAFASSGDKQSSGDKTPAIEQEETKEQASQEGQISQEEQQPQEEHQPQEEQQPQAQQQQAQPEYLFQDSDKALISVQQLQACSKAQLRLARNEIYARYGVVFGVKDLDDYFKSKSWYTPKMSLEEFYDKVEMNMIEEQNILQIQKIEKTK